MDMMRTRDEDRLVFDQSNEEDRISGRSPSNLIKEGNMTRDVQQD